MAKRRNENTPLPIDGKLRELRTLRVATVSEIVEMERRGIVPREAKTKDDVETRAKQLLAGGDYSVPGTGRDLGIALLELQRELRAIDMAIHLGEVKASQEHGARARAMYGERKDEWRGLQHRRALAVLAVLRLSGEIDDLRVELNSGGSVDSLPLDGFTPRLFGSRTTPTPCGYRALEYLDAAEKAGIISRREREDG